ncbi:MAG: hypothetical protein GKR87_12515 [Kiritimatiellae bacterium]|nr:hypothetical protein [Kiritimatiellia bacterium]
MDMDINKSEIYVPPSGPPQGPGPSKEIYALMGEENIFKMCEDFYAQLEASSIRYMFSQDMKEASKKTTAFMVGLLGGPPLYHQRYGNPQMRARHLAFPIDESARDVWLTCFKKILKQAPKTYNFPEKHLAGFITFLEEFSGWMVNRVNRMNG